MKKTHDELEREEEKTGIDLDHDGEKGESKEHKEKIEKARRKKFKEWLLEREDVHDKPGDQ